MAHQDDFSWAFSNVLQKVWQDNDLDIELLRPLIKSQWDFGIICWHIAASSPTRAFSLYKKMEAQPKTGSIEPYSSKEARFQTKNAVAHRREKNGTLGFSKDTTVITLTDAYYRTSLP